MFRDNPSVTAHHGDCNRILLDDVFPRVRYDRYRRGLCLLDPYGLHLNWEVIHRAGEMKSLEIFLNFPIADMNRNVFWRNPDGVAPADIERMNAFWGDDSWRTVAYQPTMTLFGPTDEKADNETVAEAFRQRLRAVGGFSNVPEPIPMRNTKGAIVYYLFFASQKPVAQNIVSYIFNKYRNRGAT
jgi:three-Cys-motif partner protein